MVKSDVRYTSSELEIYGTRVQIPNGNRQTTEQRNDWSWGKATLTVNGFFFSFCALTCANLAQTRYNHPSSIGKFSDDG